KGKVVQRSGPADGEGSPDGADEAKSRRDKDDDGHDNVLREAASGDAPRGSVPPTFDAFIAPTGTNRALAYHQDYSPTGMRPYGLPLAAAPALRLVWHPISALDSLS